MKQELPSPEIIDDLLTENWQLRWQVLEIFHRVQIKIRNHAQTSREHKDVLRLGKKLASHLNGPSDYNLHLIMTAAYFLGGNRFLFLIFRHLGLDDSDDFYPGLSSLKKKLSNEESDLTFFDYFHSLLCSTDAVEKTTAIAAAITIRLFSPEKSLQLLIDIPHPEPRQTAFDLFQETYPKHSFNDYLFANHFELLREQPELLRFIKPPLHGSQTEECADLAKSLLTGDPGNISTAIQAIGRLKLNNCRPLLQNLKNDHFDATTVLAQFGDKNACRELLANSIAWRRYKRLASLPALAYFNSSETLEVLKKRATKGNRAERRTALIALSQNQHPEALANLITFLKQSSHNDERRLILKLLSRHPNSTSNPKTANLLAQWHNDKDLYPELLEALAVFGYSDKWEEIVTSFRVPLLEPHHKKIALFMARFADHPAIHKNLSTLLSDIDWTFSFQLLTLLQPHLSGKDLKNLLNLMQEHEEIRELTIQERLTKGRDITSFNDALCNFFNFNLTQADEIFSRFISELMEGSLPTNIELTAHFQQQPTDLKKILLGASNFSESLPEPSLPLLHILQLLSETNLDGSLCLTAVVNQTRRYGGFFREAISTSIGTIIDHDRALYNTQALSDLQAIINFLRQRPHFDDLRQKVLCRIALITRNAKDLRIYLDAAYDHDLRIINIRRTSTDKSLPPF